MDFSGISKFKNIFCPENREDGSSVAELCKKCSINMPQWDRMVGKPFKTGNRTIYPVLEVATVGSNLPSFRGIEIFPIALVIKESGEKYTISLTDEEINPDELIGMVFKEKEKQ